jgi:hypothetical protein
MHVLVIIFTIFQIIIETIVYYKNVNIFLSSLTEKQKDILNIKIKYLIRKFLIEIITKQSNDIAEIKKNIIMVGVNVIKLKKK